MECYPRKDDYNTLIGRYLNRVKKCIDNVRTDGSSSALILTLTDLSVCFKMIKKVEKPIDNVRTDGCMHPLSFSLCSFISLMFSSCPWGFSFCVAFRCVLSLAFFLPSFFPVFFSFALSSPNFLKCTLNCHPC